VRVKMLKFITLFAVGGTERQFVYVTRGLDRSRFDIRVGCLARKGDFLKDIEEMNLPISEYSIGSLFSCRSLRRQLRLARDIRQEGIRLVHAYGFYPNLFSIPAARYAGNCVTVASVRDVGAFSNRRKIKTITQRMACQLADCVIANSRAVRDWLVSLGVPPDHVRVIPNGMVLPPRPASRGDFPIRRLLGIDPTARVIAVVCRLNEGKGLEYFLEATATVGKRFPDARFLIVGDSIVDATYKPKLERQARSFNVQDRVIFTGQRNDVPKLLEEVDLSVLPSLSEGLSNSLLEAMAAGVPVVATNVGGNPEIIEDGRTGILVPARDPAALSAAMIRILESPSLARQFGEAGRARVTSHFSLESTVRQTEELYLSLLDDRAWRHAREIRA
jgi:L-malate glycosyltransferase